MILDLKDTFYPLLLAVTGFSFVLCACWVDWRR